MGRNERGNSGRGEIGQYRKSPNAGGRQHFAAEKEGRALARVL
jgi:hypothetical protein